MHLGPKISGVQLDLLSAWRRGYSLSYILWRAGVKECRSRRTVLLIFALQVYANLQPWRTPEDLLAYLRREFYTECTLDEVTSPTVWRSRGSRSPKTFYNTNTIFIFYLFCNRSQISSKLHIKTIIYILLQNKITPPCFPLIDTQCFSLVSSLSLFPSTTLSQRYICPGVEMTKGFALMKRIKRNFHDVDS